MTDSFIQPEDNAGIPAQTMTPQGDLPVGDGDGQPDTKSPEYQIQVIQKRLQDKDEFINQLQEENRQTREMYASLEERMKNMETIDQVLKNRGQQQDVVNQDTSLDEDALVGKVIENLNKKQTEEKLKANYNSVLNRLSQEFGEQHIEEKVQQAAQSNGLSVSDMVETARKSPQAFYKLVGLEAPKTPASPMPMRGTQQPPQENTNKDFAYYARLMRENPREYWKPEVQREFRSLFKKDN